MRGWILHWLAEIRLGLWTTKNRKHEPEVITHSRIQATRFLGGKKQYSDADMKLTRQLQPRVYDMLIHGGTFQLFLSKVALFPIAIIHL